jgi:hypothetical protein
MSRIKQAAHFASFGGQARNFIDMTTRKWGRLTAVKKGSVGYWCFRCDCGVECIKDGQRVRKQTAKHEAGQAKKAPDCGGCAP